MTDPLAPIRRAAAARTLWVTCTSAQAVARLGFLQIDPMQAPARAQDLILRHRVAGYQTGQLDADYAQSPLDEDFLINYGFMHRQDAAWLHPRAAIRPLSAAEKNLAKPLLAHLAAYGPCTGKELVASFGRHTTTNGWGGTSSVVSQLLQALQWRSQLRVAGRAGGHRVYTLMQTPTAAPAPQRVRALMAVLMRTYAPVSPKGLRTLASYLKRGLPGHDAPIAAEVKRLLKACPQAVADGTAWLWPEGESRNINAAEPEGVRLLAPFDPIVWDRQRFEQLHGWAYRFEAYTPAPKRSLGHYALPLMVGSACRGWANLKVQGDRLHAEIGFTQAMGDVPHLRRDTEEELAQFAQFMRLQRQDAQISRHPRSAW